MVNEEGRRTLQVAEAAALAGVSRTLAYEEIAKTGKFAGVDVVRIGRRVLVPRARLLDVLAGESPERAERSPS